MTTQQTNYTTSTQHQQEHGEWNISEMLSAMVALDRIVAADIPDGARQSLNEANIAIASALIEVHVAQRRKEMQLTLEPTDER